MAYGAESSREVWPAAAPPALRQIKRPGGEPGRGNLETAWRGRHHDPARNIACLRRALAAAADADGVLQSASRNSRLCPRFRLVLTPGGAKADANRSSKE